MKEILPLSSVAHRIILAAALANLFVTAFAPSGASAQEYTWTDVPRIVAISDPHGAYDAMVATLIHADVIDDDRNWSGEDTHLVITGDLMDRGDDSRKIMDLLMALEDQAPDAGGMVHLVLGNHDVMNLVGDLRYVTPGEYAAFAEDESEKERERWFRNYVAQQLNFGEPDEDALRAAFNMERPPGFFGHRAAFGSDGMYGKWLLEKPMLIVINGTAFAHGGLPPLVAELGLKGINERLGSQVSDYVTQLGVLQDAGLFDPALNFYGHLEHAESLTSMPTLEPGIRQALKTIIDLHHSDAHDMDGPLWYRGNVGCNTLIEGERLTAALEAIGADRVVIGHTPTQTREVLSRHDGRVIEIDTGMLKTAYRGSGHALIIENGEVWVASENTSDLKRVVPHPRRVGYRQNDLSAANLEYVLAHGEILSSATDEAGRTIIEVRGEGEEITVNAVFTEDENRSGLNPELAAYRLDRLLGLDMVPVTVARQVDGEKGSLQLVPDNTRTEEYRSTSGGGQGAWCPLQEQWLAMYIFDALVYNPGRPQTSMLYNLENWQLILTDNDNSFGTRSGRPRYLENAPLDINSSWRAALTALDDDTLEKTFSDVLDKRRINALAKRRDQLLDLGKIE